MLEQEHYMRMALQLAQQAGQAGDVPVGCVIVDGSGRVIGRGKNRREETRSAAAHAEMAAIHMACTARGDWRLDDCTLFVTLEPCPMCTGAMINARLGTLVYGAKEPLTGSCCSILDLFSERYPGHTAVYAGVLAEESRALLQAFFTAKREENAIKKPLRAEAQQF